MAKAKTLVTGGTGFLGGHLIDRLLERGDDVRVLTRYYDDALAARGVDVIEGSLTAPEDVRRAVEGVTRVYHLAGRVDRDPAHAHKMYELHVEGTRVLLDALRDVETLEKVVVASTSGTVGVGASPDFVADDESPTVEILAKRWPYYLSKIYTERVCERYEREHRMPIVILRPTLLLGPGDWRESSIGDVVLFMKEKVPTLMTGGLSFVDVRDVADAFITAMETAESGSKYLLGGMNCTISEFFEMLEDLTGIKKPWIPMPNEAAIAGARLLNSALKLIGKSADLDPTTVEMATYYWYIDWSKAERDLDFTPRSPVKTLRDTVRWIQKNHADFGAGAIHQPPEGLVPKETLEHARSLRD